MSKIRLAVSRVDLGGGTKRRREGPEVPAEEGQRERWGRSKRRRLVRTRQ